MSMADAKSGHNARGRTPAVIFWYIAASFECVVTLLPCILLWPLGAIGVVALVYGRALASAFRRAAAIWKARVRYGRKATWATVLASDAMPGVADSNVVERELGPVGRGRFEPWLN